MYLQPQDFLESEGYAYPQGGYTYGYMAHDSVWEGDNELSCIDPELRPPPNVVSHCSTTQRQCHTAYDPMAHGFAHPVFQRQTSGGSLYPNVLTNPWIHDLDQARPMRYLSPTEPGGSTFSSNASTLSDYALSPDAGGSPRDVPLQLVNADFYVPTYRSASSSDHIWSPGPCLLPPLATSSPSHQIALSLRDLQVTPDPEIDDDIMDDKDVLPSRMPPEELELSDQAASPANSGLGQSIDGKIKDEVEDSGAHNSDHDKDFVPARRSQRRCVTATRRAVHSSQRSPARGVTDKKSHVHKPSRAPARPNGPNNSRSKFKRIPQVDSDSASANKSFHCAFHHYGCRSTFASKNEWKRHVASQHLQLGYYRCDMGDCIPEVAGKRHPGYNDFNRKDLFTQHCRRMHAPWVASGKGAGAVTKKERVAYERQLENIRTRCWVDQRTAPEKSSCGFCGQEFVNGPDCKAWQERMEHVGRHLEKDGLKVEDEQVDEGLKEWALVEGVIRAGRKKGTFWLVDLEPAAADNGGKAGRRGSGRLGEEDGQDDGDDEDEAEDEAAEVDDE